MAFEIVSVTTFADLLPNSGQVSRPGTESNGEQHIHKEQGLRTSFLHLLPLTIFPDDLLTKGM